MMSAEQALQRLKDGNRDFVDHISTSDTLAGLGASAELIQNQQPFAVVIGCSDSRAPAETVFNQGIGDLFVIRVAGNILSPALIGSVEFAAAKLGTRLVVVMGHTQCGAVAATLDALEKPDDSLSPNLQSIVDAIRPAAEDVRHNEQPHDHSAFAAATVRANVDQSVAQLAEGSELLQNLIDTDGLQIVGAEYAVETGKVEFFD